MKNILLSSRRFIALVLIFTSVILLHSLLYIVLIYSLGYGYPHGWSKRLFPAFSYLDTFVENQLLTHLWIYFWSLRFVPLIYMPILLPITHGFAYSKSWNHIVFFKFGRSLKLFWKKKYIKSFQLIPVLCISMYILESGYQFLPLRFGRIALHLLFNLWKIGWFS